jgi:hypothetical protein
MCMGVFTKSIKNVLNKGKDYFKILKFGKKYKDRKNNMYIIVVIFITVLKDLEIKRNAQESSKTGH